CRPRRASRPVRNGSATGSRIGGNESVSGRTLGRRSFRRRGVYGPGPPAAEGKPAVVWAGIGTDRRSPQRSYTVRLQWHSSFQKVVAPEGAAAADPDYAVAHYER